MSEKTSLSSSIRNLAHRDRSGARNDLNEMQNKSWGVGVAKTDAPNNESLLTQRVEDSVVEIPIEQLSMFRGRRNKVQPFEINEQRVKQIAESIKTIDITTPLIVRKKGDVYQILSGHHRFKACKLLEMDKVPCFVRKVNDDEADRYVIECNIQRMKLLPSELSEMIGRYMDIREDIDMTVKELESKFGINYRVLYRYQHISELCTRLKRHIDEGRVYVEMAEKLAVLTNEQQEKLCDLIDNYKKTITPKIGAKILEMFANYPNLDDITDEMYEECFAKAKKSTYKNKVYKKVWDKYPNIPEEKRLTEEQMDGMVATYFDDYIVKTFSKEEVEVKAEEKTESPEEELEK